MTEPEADGQAPAVAQARRLVELAVQALEQTRERPVDEHVVVLGDVHRALQDALAALDEV